MRKETHLKTEFGSTQIIYKRTTWYLLGFIPVFRSTLKDDK